MSRADDQRPSCSRGDEAATHHGQRGEASRICSGTNAALNLRGALLDMIYQAKAGRQFRAPSAAVYARSPNPKRVAYSAWGSFRGDTALNFHHIEKAPDPRRGAADCGEYRQAAGAIAQYKKAPTQTTGPSDYQQKINVRFQLLVP